ncbi:MAG: nucleoside-triphosphatase, partial [Aggregatilineales bacterium]
MMSATTPTPADLLARLLAEPPPRVALVTGDSGAGKTTWCRSLVEAARQRGLRVAGLLSPPVFEQGVKTGIDLLDLTTGERRRLAARRPVPDPDAAVR